MDEVKPPKTLNIVEVDNKYDNGWPADLIYSEYNVMIILIYTNNVLESIQRAKILKEKFDKIFGKNNWLFFDNYGDNLDDVIFTRDLNKIFHSMLLDNEAVKEIIDEIRIFKETK